MGVVISTECEIGSKISMEVFPKTVYTDLVDLPDPMLLGLTIHYYNHSDIALYMKIFIAGTNWSSGSVEMGSLGSGTDAYRNLDNFSSRAKPASETTETMSLTLKGYSDAGYSTELYSFSRDVTIIMIKSDDGTWTLDEEDNFDDGTVQGWACSGCSFFEAAGDYVLSAPYSLRAWRGGGGSGHYKITLDVYKSFLTPDKPTVYAIFNIRSYGVIYMGVPYDFIKIWEIKKNSDVLVHLGRTYDIIHAHYAPNAKWIRIVVPLPRSVTLTLHQYAEWVCYQGGFDNCRLWLDDFKIISKD